MRSVFGRHVLLFLLGVALLLCGCREGVVIAAVAAPHHVRVVWTEAPQTRALIAWDTGAVRGERHGVWVGIGGAAGEPMPLWVDAHETDEYDGRGTFHYHHVQLSALPPDTVVRFAVDSDDRRSREFFFRTAPEQHRDFAFLSGGDSRSHRESRRGMNRQLARIAATDDEVIALAHGGDYIYSGWKLEQWQGWLDDKELAIPESGRLLPIIPARGNHEAGGPMFDQMFGSPGGGLGQNFFTTELSNEVALVTLNTERAAGGIQLEFLQRSLKEQHDKRYRIVQYHRPIFPAVKNPYPGKWTWQPVFEAMGVAFVLESDGHVLKGTLPLIGDEPRAGGIIYLGEGGLGVKQRTPHVDRWYLQSPGFAMAAHHVWKVEFRGESCFGVALGMEGEELHRVELPPRAAAK